MNNIIITEQRCGCQGYNELRVAFGNLQNCQLKCPFCFTLEQRPAIETPGDLQKRDLTRTKIIRFTGGEPLLDQEQIDVMVEQIGILEKTVLTNLQLIVIQTNAISVDNRNINGLLQFKLPIIFEVSLKGTNEREYQYLTSGHFLSRSQAEVIFQKQIKGYSIIASKCANLNTVSVLARLGLFHSSITKPSFRIIFPDTKELMFNPDHWSREFTDIYLDQKQIWGDTFEGKVVVEKIKTPADGNPVIGKRYRTIIESLKRKGLLQESQELLPKIYQEHYFYKRGNEIYNRCEYSLVVV